jgi:uncharacterized protein YbjQ (UPF0145 family)
VELLKKAYLPNHKNVTGLSGNEIFCLYHLGLNPGPYSVGNSVLSLGVVKSFGAGIKGIAGGEIEHITELVHQGRVKALSRLIDEAKKANGDGVSGVSFDIINHGGQLEFLAQGSAIYHQKEILEQKEFFSTSSNVQALYCMQDAEFHPLQFVFGNVAYSIGVGGNVLGSFKSLQRGEVKEFTDIFDRTRHLALKRIKDEAKKCGANAVVGIETTLSTILGAQEMLMVGTAATHPLLDDFKNNPVTSDMTCEEMWNMMHLGIMPIELVMGVSVYSLGLISSVGALFQTIGGGEIDGLTEILYEAREKALDRLNQHSINCGADEVIGVKTKIYDLGGGMIEFLAIGTAVKKVSGAKTIKPQLPPQAIIVDRETYFETSPFDEMLTGKKMPNARSMQQGPLLFFVVILILLFRVLVPLFLQH